MLVNGLARLSCPVKKEGGGENCIALKKGFACFLQSLHARGFPDAVKAFESYLKDAYEAEMFPYGWMKDIQIRDDVDAVKRLFAYIGKGMRVLAVSVPVEVYVDCLKEELRHEVSMVCSLNNHYVAVNVHLSKPAGRSEKGRSLQTKAFCEPSAIVTKLALEKEYPGILVYDAYLRADSDRLGAISPMFLHDGTAASQMHVLDYQGYDEKGLTQLLEEVVQEGVKPKCHFCDLRERCLKGAPVLQPCYGEGEEKPSYILPSYTKEQECAISSPDGQVLVVAGPGSGKTATLVGRVRYLTGTRQVPPEYILSITFAKEAAREIASRCASFLKKGEMLKVCTLHALGYQILREHAHLLPTAVKLLTPSDRQSIVSVMLEALGQPLPGFSYGDKDMLISAVCRKLDQFMKNPDGFSMEQTEPVFLAFAMDYKKTIEAGGFIGFPEQISLCVELLKEHPEVLLMYQKMYQHVLVDEYQDIDDMQHELIRLLVGKSGDLLCIGDDDQSVYGFRGGSHKHMLSFLDDYPKGKVIKLTTNFRSTESIVHYAAEVLDYEGRIQKEVTAAKKGGISPKHLQGDFNTCAKEAVKKLVKDGYSYGDIAILSFRNKPLEELFGKKEDIPMKLEKETLQESAFFALLKIALMLYENREDDFLLKEYFSLYQLSVPENVGVMLEAEKGERPYVEVGSVESALCVLKALLDAIQSGMPAEDFITYGATISGYLGQSAYSELLNLVDVRVIKTMDKLLQEMLLMEEAKEDVRLRAEKTDEVLLTTMHEAKGREWKACIVLQDFSLEKEESKRIYYVALTRAKESLVIITP